MNSWVLVYLAGQNGTNVIIKGPYPDEATAEAAAISTGAPYNYQPCQVWGPAVPPPMGTLAPVNAPVGSWLAVTSGITPAGGVKPIAYGTFDSIGSAQSWSGYQGNPAAFSFGQVAAM